MLQKAKKSLTKILTILSVLCLCFAMFAFTACAGKDGEPGAAGTPGENGVGITSAVVNEEGKLIITLTDGTTVDAGSVVGAPGQPGQDGSNGNDGAPGEPGAAGVGVASVTINENGELVVKLTDGTETNLGVVVGSNGNDGAPGATGEPGAPGKDGVGVASVAINEDGELIVKLTNNEELNLGVVVGSNGNDGAPGAAGADGVGIKDIKVENGKIIISLTDDETVYTFDLPVIEVGGEEEEVDTTVYAEDGLTAGNMTLLAPWCDWEINENNQFQWWNKLTTAGEAAGGAPSQVWTKVDDVTRNNGIAFKFDSAGTTTSVPEGWWNGYCLNYFAHGLTDGKLYEISFYVKNDGWTGRSFNLIYEADAPDYAAAYKTVSLTGTELIGEMGTAGSEWTKFSFQFRAMNVPGKNWNLLRFDVLGNPNELMTGSLYLDSIAIEEIHECDYYTFTVEEPTCGKVGKEVSVCKNDCGKTIVRDIPALEHDYEVVTHAPTCTEEGYDIEVCKNDCGIDGEKSNIVPALGHAYNELGAITVVEPTCTTDGSCTWICDVCGDRKVTDWTNVYTAAATGDYAGWWPQDWVTVNGNDITFKGENQNIHFATALTLKPGKYTLTGTWNINKLVVKNAGCEAKVFISTLPSSDHRSHVDAITADAVCGLGDGESAENEVIDMAISFTVETEGTYYVRFMFWGIVEADATINDIMLQRSLKATGHSHEAVVTPPTCYEDGYTTYTCPACGDTYTGDIVPTTGHAWDEGHQVIEEGRNFCEEGGIFMYICTAKDCGEVKYDTVSAPGHHSDDWNVKTAPTTATEGVLEGICSNCGLFKEIKIPAFNTTDYTYEVIEAKRDCGDTGTATYTIVVDGQEIVFNVEIPATFHKYDANTELDDTKVHKFEDYPNLNFAGNSGLACGHGNVGTAYFTCVECNELIVIQATVPHTQGDKLSETPATCCQDGSITYDCAVCGDDYTVTVPATGAHVYEYTFTANADGKTGTLSGKCVADATCTETVTYTITEADGLVITEQAATCEAAGFKKFSFTKDGTPYEVVQEIKQLSHTFNGKDVVVDGTATYYINADGSAYYVTAAGDKVDLYTAEEAKAEGFKGIDLAGNSIVACDAAAGVGYFTCDGACGGLMVVAVKSAHVAGDIVTEVPATCEADGYIIYKCAECGNNMDPVKTDDKLGHSMTYTVSGSVADGFKITEKCANGCGHDVTTDAKDVKEEITTPATCHSVGVKTYTVTMPDNTTKSFTEEIPVTTHVLNGKEIDDTLIYYISDVDGVYYNDGTKNVTIYTAQDLADGKVGEGFKVAGNSSTSCAEDGTYGTGYFKCANEGCGEVIIVKVKTGHTYTEADIVEKVEPSCVSDGKIVYNCKDCGKEQVTIIPNLGGHKIEWVVETAPTATETGKAYPACTNAGCNVGPAKFMANLPVLGDAAYTVETVEAAGCNKQGIDKYTIAVSVTTWDNVGQKVVTIEGTVSFNVVTPVTTHTLTGALLTWTEGDYYYEGKLCADCNHVIVGRKVLIDQLTDKTTWYGWKPFAKEEGDSLVFANTGNGYARTDVYLEAGKTYMLTGTWNIEEITINNADGGAHFAMYITTNTKNDRIPVTNAMGWAKFYIPNKSSVKNVTEEMVLVYTPETTGTYYLHITVYGLTTLKASVSDLVLTEYDFAMKNSETPVFSSSLSSYGSWSNTGSWLNAAGGPVNGYIGGTVDFDDGYMTITGSTNMYVTNYLYLEAGKTYTLSFKWKADKAVRGGANKSVVSIYDLSLGGAISLSSYVVEAEAHPGGEVTCDWTEVTKTFTVDATEWYGITIWNYAIDSGELSFKDVVVK